MTNALTAVFWSRHHCEARSHWQQWYRNQWMGQRHQREWLAWYRRSAHSRHFQASQCHQPWPFRQAAPVYPQKSNDPPKFRLVCCGSMCCWCRVAITCLTRPHQSDRYCRLSQTFHRQSRPFHRYEGPSFGWTFRPSTPQRSHRKSISSLWGFRTCGKEWRVWQVLPMDLGKSSWPPQGRDQTFLRQHEWSSLPSQ